MLSRLDTTAEPNAEARQTFGEGVSSSPGCLEHPRKGLGIRDRHCHAPPLQTPLLVPPSLAERTTWVSKGLRFRAAPACCFLNLSCPWCVDTKGWRGHPYQAELSPCPEGDGSGVPALAAGLGTCLRSWHTQGMCTGRQGQPPQPAAEAPVHKKQLFHLAETLRSKTRPTHIPIAPPPQLPSPCSHPTIRAAKCHI